jgi:hypothetical protein
VVDTGIKGKIESEKILSIPALQFVNRPAQQHKELFKFSLTFKSKKGT